jgi:imidazole glycerol-phosphate synthase subunit HisF
VLRARIIPCLLVHDRGLVKTTRFGAPKYVGDPLNAVRIFNEKEVDELVVLDIDATARGAEPDYTMIRQLAAECRMPLCYGGGVHSVEQAQRILQLGVEKVALGHALVADPSLATRLAQRIGAQSVVAVLDVRRHPRTGAYELFTVNGTRPTGLEPAAFAAQLEALGVGEVLINAIDRDGVMKGYDLELVERVRQAVTVPITVLGGAGSTADIGGLIERYGIIGAAAGSLFVFKGIYRAVLINYPGRADKDRLTGRAARR